MKPTHTGVCVIKGFLRELPNENCQRESEINSSFGPQRRCNLGAIHHDYSGTKGINEENILFQLHIMKKEERG